MLVVQAFQQVISRIGILIKPKSLKDIMTVLEARVVMEGKLARFSAERTSAMAVQEMEGILARQEALPVAD
jgi:DNA-binding GntR family transcriptional regulator